MQKTSQQKPITSNEVSGIGSPITAWAVEIEGKIDPADVYPSCDWYRWCTDGYLYYSVLGGVLSD